METYDLAVVGGGIVGTATALALARREVGSVVLLEAEEHLATHQSGHNSGVVHSGLYYRPGSLKARLCVDGREALYRLCAEDGIAHRRCGKLVVATGEDELPALAELERRGRANGLAGLERLDAAGLARHEPHAVGIAGLHVAETGVVDFRQVAQALARRFRAAGGELLTGARVGAVAREPSAVRLDTAGGAVRCRHLVACAGLGSDRLARRCGVEPGVRILPFRGDYFALVPARAHLVRALVYPVPDPELPFLGVHLTRTVDDRVEAGPNAVLALSRRRYSRFAFSFRDTLSTLLYPGFWRLARRYWRTGIAELRRSFSRRAFATAAARLLPALGADDLSRAGCGIRAQAVDRRGRLVDDFHLAGDARTLHLLNAPSPAATASLAIAETLAERALEQFALG
jgi:L-2-hydroxyglutarate oxidase